MSKRTVLNGAVVPEPGQRTLAVLRESVLQFSR